MTRPTSTDTYDENNLLNTAYQVKELGKRLPEFDYAMIVGWAFHLKRIQMNFGALRAEMPPLWFVSADSVIERLWSQAGPWGETQTERSRHFQDAYGLTVDWPVVKEGGLQTFAARERKTRLALAVGHSGWALNAITRFKGSGRRDELTSEGMAIFEDTMPPRYPKTWGLAAALLDKH